jgi:hypothetical protein
MEIFKLKLFLDYDEKLIFNVYEIRSFLLDEAGRVR